MLLLCGDFLAVARPTNDKWHFALRQSGSFPFTFISDGTKVVQNSSPLSFSATWTPKILHISNSGRWNLAWPLIPKSPTDWWTLLTAEIMDPGSCEGTNRARIERPFFLKILRLTTQSDNFSRFNYFLWWQLEVDSLVPRDGLFNQVDHKHQHAAVKSFDIKIIRWRKSLVTCKGMPKTYQS